MKSLLLLPLLFIIPPQAYASTISVQSTANGGGNASVHVNSNSTTYSNNTTTTTNGNTDVYTNVNGKVQEYHSSGGGNVSVVNDGTNSSVTINGETKTSPSSSTSPSPTPILNEAQLRARIASEQAKMKAKMDEAKKKLEDQQKVLNAHAFDLRTFFQDLFKKIFHL